MKILFALSFLFSGFLLAQNDFYLGGIQVNEPDQSKWVDALQTNGMNTVAVTVYATQGEWDSDSLTWAAEEPAVIEEVRTAKAAGMKVVLILRLKLDYSFERNQFLWHGMVMPKDEEKLRSWFEKYGQFVAQWANTAEQEGIDVLGIGSELNALSTTQRDSPLEESTASSDFVSYHYNLWKRTKPFQEDIDPDFLQNENGEQFSDVNTFMKAKYQANRTWAKQFYLKGRSKQIAARCETINGLWLELIAKAKKQYNGQLTYAANHDNLEVVGFWDALDIIGVNAYFPLRDKLTPYKSWNTPTDEIYEGWEEVFDDLNQFKEDSNLEDKPILFTELGYTFRKNCTVQPWTHGGFSLVTEKGRDRLVVWKKEGMDYGERAFAIQSLLIISQEKMADELIGILFWKLSTDLSHRDVEPFTIHIGSNTSDPLLVVLRQFQY